MTLKNIKTLLFKNNLLEQNTGVYIISSVFFAFIGYCFYISSALSSNINTVIIEQISAQSSMIKNSIIITATLIMIKLIFTKHISNTNILLISAISMITVFLFSITSLHTYLLIIPVFAALLTVYIENKTTDKIYYLLIGLIIVIANSTFVSTIGMGFFKHMQLSEIQKMKNDMDKLTNPCNKYQCIVLEEIKPLNISSENKEFYYSNRFFIEDNISKNISNFNTIDKKTNALIVGKKINNTTTIIVEKEKINMFKHVSTTWINFLSIIAGAFWVYIGCILLHYHKNRKIRTLAKSNPEI